MINCIYDTSIYLGRDGQNASETIKVTLEILKSLNGRLKGAGHKVYMKSFVLQLYLMTSMQQLLAVAELLHKIVNAYCSPSL
jgi:hypothetical protein